MSSDLSKFTELTAGSLCEWAAVGAVSDESWTSWISSDSSGGGLEVVPSLVRSWLDLVLSAPITHRSHYRSFTRLQSTRRTSTGRDPFRSSSLQFYSFPPYPSQHSELLLMALVSTRSSMGGRNPSPVRYSRFFVRRRTLIMNTELNPIEIWVLIGLRLKINDIEIFCGHFSS